MKNAQMIDFPAELILQSIHAPMLLIGPNQRVIVQNGSMTEVLKIDFTGRNYVTALRQPAVINAIETAISEQSHQTARYLARMKGVERTYLASVVPQRDHLLVIFEDQTAAQVTDTVRRDFVANVSHELRTPLTALLGFIETLQGPARDDPKARDRFLGIMAAEADRLRRLVDDLLSLSRVEETERSRPVEPVNIKAIAAQAVEVLDPIAAAQDTHFILDMTDEDTIVPGDPTQLQQVLTNLIENAVKYGATPDGITVRVAKPAYESALRTTCVRVTVTDHGIGIAPHHLIRLTERFYRVDNHRDREKGGTGLGLAIVKHIVQRHNGKLYFESVEGQGMSVTLLLPLDANA